ncbi:MAG: hypothetical protein M0R17_14095 [Candidatus Omnitrophica bacterium]|jgi:hypothetical protein|nr:hypothetical protein [Candidatus Omnitrophota bacterium]MDD5253381.1 hypothetical protein [Candidatus Omnitrophota bacterium]
MDKMKLCIFCAVFLAFCQSLVLGETVLLKSGQKVEGRVIENTDKYVKLDFHGVELTYYKDEVASIIQGVQGSGDTVSPQLESLYQAYTSSLNIPQKQNEENIAEAPIVEFPAPVVAQSAENTPVASTNVIGTNISQLSPEYQKMIQSVMQTMQSVQANQQKGGVGNPVAGIPGVDISQLPPEYQKIIQSAMVNMQTAQSGIPSKDKK